MEWTEKAVALLKQYWNSGWPTIDIAEKLGTTRNAVIGRVDRLKRRGELEARFSDGKGYNKTKRSEKRVKATAAPVPLRHFINSKPVPPTPLPETPLSSAFLGLAFEELEPWQCRYPAGGDRGKPITFCGQRRRQDSSYCDHCHNICWVPLRKRS